MSPGPRSRSTAVSTSTDAHLLTRVRTCAGSGRPTQGEPGPHVAETCDERLDVGVAVQWRGCQPQALGAARHGRIVDRLHIDAVTAQELVAGGSAQRRAPHSRTPRGCPFPPYILHGPSLMPQISHELIDGEAGVGDDTPERTLADLFVVGHDNAAIRTVAAEVMWLPVCRRNTKPERSRAFGLRDWTGRRGVSSRRLMRPRPQRIPCQLRSG
jgi:hypothetical protein